MGFFKRLILRENTRFDIPKQTTIQLHIIGFACTFAQKIVLVRKKKSQYKLKITEQNQDTSMIMSINKNQQKK